MRNQRAVSADIFRSKPFHSTRALVSGSSQSGQAEAAKHLVGQRTGKAQGRLAASSSGQFHVVHDDEVLKMGDQLFVLVGGHLQFQRIFIAPDVQVALDAALGVEHQVPCAGMRGQVVDHVGHHAAEPAETVLAVDGNAAQPSQIVDGGRAEAVPLFRGLARPTAVASTRRARQPVDAAWQRIQAAWQAEWLRLVRRGRCPSWGEHFRGARADFRAATPRHTAS